MGWNRLRDARLIPLAYAPVMTALAIVEGVLDATFRPELDRIVLVACWIGLSFVLAAGLPTAGAVTMSGYYLLGELTDTPGPGGAGLVSALIALGWAGYADPPRRSRIGLAAGIALFLGANVVDNGTVWDAMFFVVIFVPAWWCGLLVRRERERRLQIAELAAALDAEREASARSAVLDERTRIAREVHDSVAHAVSVMTLQIGGLRRQLDDVLSQRPAERDVVLGLERLGRETVEELRGLVGILREPDAATPTGAPPSLARVADLVGDVRAAGLPVELRLDGEFGDLPRTLDGSAFRVLQEALSNVIRHAPGSRTTVQVSSAAGAVTVEVRDDGSGAPSSSSSSSPASNGGHGLVGMRERVALCGGSLQVGPDGAGYLVRARFPLARTGR